MSLDRAECERVLKLVSTEFADQHVLLSDGTSELLLKTTDGTKHPTWANMHYLARLLRQALAELDAAVASQALAACPAAEADEHAAQTQVGAMRIDEIWLDEGIHAALEQWYEGEKHARKRRGSMVEGPDTHSVIEAVLKAARKTAAGRLVDILDAACICTIHEGCTLHGATAPPRQYAPSPPPSPSHETALAPDAPGDVRNRPTGNTHEARATNSGTPDGLRKPDGITRQDNPAAVSPSRHETGERREE